MFTHRIRGKMGMFVVPLALAVGACSDDEPTGLDNEEPIAQISASPLDVPAGDGNQTVVTIDGSNSSDPDGDLLTYSWTVQNGTFVGGTTDSDAVIQVTFPGTAPYLVTLTVSDGNGGSDVAEITIGII